MGKQFNREAWLATKQERLAEAKAALEDGLRNIQTSEDWQKLLATMAEAGALAVLRYSFGNQILIQCGRPGTRRAATYLGWREHNRHVREGERGIPILAPIFRSKDHPPLDPDEQLRPIAFKAVTVFALEQTEGEPIPEPKLPDIAADEAFEGSLERLRNVSLKAEGKPVATITFRERESGDPATANGWYERPTKQIVVITDDRTRAQQFRTLCHELAHALLHAEGDGHSRPDREVEAESTAFIVCHALGLDSGVYSFPYVATWTGDQDAPKRLAESGQRISTAAAKILDALCDGEDPTQTPPDSHL